MGAENLKLKARYLWGQMMRDLGLPEDTNFVCEAVLQQSSSFAEYKEVVTEIIQAILSVDYERARRDIKTLRENNLYLGSISNEGRDNLAAMLDSALIELGE